MSVVMSPNFSRRSFPHRVHRSYRPPSSVLTHDQWWCRCHRQVRGALVGLCTVASSTAGPVHAPGHGSGRSQRTQRAGGEPARPTSLALPPRCGCCVACGRRGTPCTSRRPRGSACSASCAVRSGNAIAEAWGPPSNAQGDQRNDPRKKPGLSADCGVLGRTSRAWSPGSTAAATEWTMIAHTARSIRRLLCLFSL